MFIITMQRDFSIFYFSDTGIGFRINAISTDTVTVIISLAFYNNEK